MTKTIKIAFDLDGVIVDKPPLIPKKLLEFLFRGKKKEDKLHYRFPKLKVEQYIRKLSHFYLFRPPIKENINFIKQIAKDSKYEIYVVSARYSFLKKETDLWLKKRGIKNLFKKIYLNFKDEQPHLFKERILKEIGADIFIDDDELLVEYLSKRIKGDIYCFFPNGRLSSFGRQYSSLKKIFLTNF